MITWAVALLIAVLAVAGVSTDDQTVPWWTVGVALVAAVGTGLPLLRWLRPAVDALLFSHPNDAQELIAQVGRQIQAPATSAAGAVDPSAQIAHQIARRLRLPYVQIGALDESPAAEDPRLVELPLAFAGEAVGWLAALPRARDRALSAQDLDLLHDLAGQIGIVLHATRAAAALGESRAALITAREEERRRIRRDLHDGLGPTLASLRLHLAAAEQLVADRPDEARAMLRRVRDEVGETSAQIRQLVYELRPSMLDELGLLAALRARAADLGGAQLVDFQLEAPDPLPAMPAAIEVALYRIASEAMTNVVRHSAAQRAAIRLAVSADSVELTVQDDGRGIPADLVEGVGLRSMRERAEELRGSLAIGPGAASGALLRAELPFAAAR